jgi:O-antigen/teichoic acid export membrane protein
MTARTSDVRTWVKRAFDSAMLPAALATALRIGGNLILVPLILFQLSVAEQALWWVFVALGNVAQLADLGLGNAFSRVYSYLWAGLDDFEAQGLKAVAPGRSPNLKRIREVHATVSRLYWSLSILATGVLAVGGSAYLRGSLPQGVGHSADWYAWGLYVGVVGLGLGSTHWNLACQGVNRVRELHRASFWSSLAYLVTVALLLFQGLGLMALVLWAAVRALLARELVRRAYLAAVPPDGVKTRLDWEIVRRLWPNAQKFGILAVGAYLINNGTVLLCNSYLGKEATASFGLTVTVGGVLAGTAGMWLGVKWPRLAMLRTQGQLEELGFLFARRLSLVMGTYVLLALLVVLFGNRILEWKGSQGRLLPDGPLIFYLVYLGHHLFYVQFGLLTFTENVVALFKVGLFSGVAVVSLSWLAVGHLGLWGLLVAPLVGESLITNWYVVIRGFRSQPLSPLQFARAAAGLKP